MFVKVAIVIFLSLEIESCKTPRPPLQETTPGVNLNIFEWNFSYELSTQYFSSLSKLFQIQFQTTISVGQPGFAGRITAIITKTGPSKNDGLITWWQDWTDGGKWKESYLSLTICAKYDKISENCCTIEKLRRTEDKYTVEFVKE